jgi:chromosome segregation ATPase
VRNALTEATEARQRHMLEGDLTDEQNAEKLQAKVDSCSSKLTGWDAALNALQAEIADVEQKVAAERAAIERAAAADKLAQQIAAVEATLPTFMSAGGALTDALSAISFHYETGEMARFLSNTMTQLEIAAGVSLAELGATVGRIKTGEAAIPRVEPEPAPLAVIEQPPPTQTVFCR